MDNNIDTTKQCAAQARLRRIDPRPDARFLFVVLHTSLDHDTVGQALLAFGAGADGVMLCAWPASVTIMLEKLAAVRAAVGNERFVGVNFMQNGEELSVGLEPGALAACDAVWYDKGVDGGGDGSGRVNPEMLAIQAALARVQFTGLQFGGFAFKGQAAIPTERLASLGPLALRHCGVPTTSGAGTGVAMDPARTTAVRDAVGAGALLAMASGVNAQNISAYLEQVDIFIVATGIEQNAPCPLASGAEAVPVREELCRRVGEVAGSLAGPEGGGAGTAAAAPAEAAVRALCQFELDQRLSTEYSLSKQTGFSSGLLSAWVEGCVSGRADVAVRLWERMVKRADAMAGADVTERHARFVADQADHLEQFVAERGASALVVPGALDSSKVEALARAVHAHGGAAALGALE